jgi:tetratricopeptide (TPR) repeat protein
MMAMGWVMQPIELAIAAAIDGAELGLELGDFAIWFGSIGLVLAFALGSMLWAYKGQGSRSILFLEPVELPDDNDHRLPKAIAAFNQGRELFTKGDYRAASDRFAAALQLAPNWPEAYHNWGLALANLLDDNEAAPRLVKAGDLYLNSGNLQGSALLRRHLSAMVDRKKQRQAAKAG